MIVSRRYCLPPTGPISQSAAVMDNGNNADYVNVQPINQGIRKAVKSQRPSAARADPAQFGKATQVVKRLIDLISKIIHCNERAFPDTPIDGSMGVGLRLVAKVDPR